MINLLIQLLFVVCVEAVHPIHPACQEPFEFNPDTEKYRGHQYNAGIRRPKAWKGNMKEQIRTFLDGVPWLEHPHLMWDHTTEYDEHDNQYMRWNFAYVKVSDRKLWHIHTQGGTWICDTLHAIMNGNPDFLKHDFEFLLAEHWLSTELIRYAARRYGVTRLNLTKEEIPAYQEKIIKLFENAPFLMPSQIHDASFHPNFDH